LHSRTNLLNISTNHKPKVLIGELLFELSPLATDKKIDNPPILEKKLTEDRIYTTGRMINVDL